MRELLGRAVDSSKRKPNEVLVSQDKFISEMKFFLASRAIRCAGASSRTSEAGAGSGYDMNVQKAREYARYVRGQDTGALDMCPAQDFARVKSHRVPRADRPVCWRVSSGEIRGGRMAALKSDPVWEKLSRFGRRYTPIDYGSGMGMEDIDRDEAGELGLEAEVSLYRIPEGMPEEIVRETFDARIEGGKLKMCDKKSLPTWGGQAPTERKNLQIFCNYRV